MPIIRTLLFQAARHLAQNPDVREKAAKVSRDHVVPAARTAARRAGEATRGSRDALSEEIRAVRTEAAPETTRAELAGRVTRRMFDRLKGDTD